MNMVYGWSHRFSEHHYVEVLLNTTMCVFGIGWPLIGLQLHFGPFLLTYAWKPCKP